jgi:hypothetical protein
LDYAALNSAFRILMGGGEFIALAQNRAFRDSNGELSPDAGASIAALKYANGVKGARIGQASGSVFPCGLVAVKPIPEAGNKGRTLSNAQRLFKHGLGLWRWLGNRLRSLCLGFWSQCLVSPRLAFRRLM